MSTKAKLLFPLPGIPLSPAAGPDGTSEPYDAARVTHDAYAVIEAGQQITPNVRITALPLPIDPERFRDLHDDYLMYSQTVGSNPFALKISHTLAGGFVGDALRGTKAGAFALAGHEVGSGVAQTGTDTMFVVTHRMPGLLLSALRYRCRQQRRVSSARFAPLPSQARAYRQVRGDSIWRMRADTIGIRAWAAPLMSSGGLAQLHLDPTRDSFLDADLVAAFGASNARIGRSSY
jgi:hypothetical protein